jgi:hypothetical protein
MGGVPTGGNPVKNIIIGVLTTVIAYVIVHFLFDKKGDNQKKKTKTATIEAWKSLVKFEEMGDDNFFLAYCNEDPVAMLETMAYEKDQQAKNYETIRSKPDIDEDMASFIARTTGFATETKKIFAGFAMEIQQSKEDVTSTEEVKAKRLKTKEDQYSEKMIAMEKRESDAMTAIMKTLVEKYGNEFVYVRDSTFTEEELIGKWKETGIDKTFELNPDYTLAMVADNVSYPGKWKLTKNILTITFSDGSLALHIIRFHDRYFRFKVNDEELERQCCKVIEKGQ